MIFWHNDIRAVDDIVRALKSEQVRDIRDIHEFIDAYASELCRIVKPGNKVNVYEINHSGSSGEFRDPEIAYFCSNCDSRLADEEAGWHYCNYCLAPFDCCDESDEPCDVCGREIVELVYRLAGIYNLK